jgi:hypothetical protein
MVQVADVTLTVVVAMTELFAGFASATAEEAVAVFEITVPLVVAGFTFRTIVNDALAPEMRLALVQLTAPVPPAAGVVQVHPSTEEIETNVVFAGVESESVTPVASSGPRFVTPIV